MTSHEVELYALAGLQADPSNEEAQFLDAVVALARKDQQSDHALETR